MNIKKTIYRTAFYSIIVVQALILLSVPLIHMMNDSGWYYMNVHFITEGEYINESRYPSFDQPSQLYSFFGYSSFLFICKKIAFLTGASFSGLVKCGQFLMYIFSAILVRQIVTIITKKENLSYVIATLFVLYYPHFNYVNLVMSETSATFLILLTIYLFVKTQIEYKGPTVIWLFLLTGYVFLVKPVFFPISIVIVFLFALSSIRGRKYFRLLNILLLFIFPLAQSLFSKAYYDNYKLQTGLGWHMWNRVIFEDKLIPTASEHLEKIKLIYSENNRPVSFGYWWDITKDLSEFGFKETETQKICGEIAFDGIAEFPCKYLANTFKNCYVNFLQPNDDIIVFNNSAQYFNELQKFSEEQQHKPLTDELLQQTQYRSPFFNAVASFNFNYARLAIQFNRLFHNPLIFFLYVLAGIHAIYILLASKFRKNINEFLIWFTAFSIIFSSNISEYPQPRLMQPAIIFVILILAVKFNELKNTKSEARSAGFASLPGI